MLNKSAMLRLTFATAFLLGAANLALAQSVTAQSAADNLAVSASVSKRCTISTTALDFGAYDPIGAQATAPLNGSGSVSVACTKGSASLTIGLSNGANAATGVQRYLKDSVSGDLLPYGLFQPGSTASGTACSFPATTAWDNSTTLGLTAPTSKAERTYNVCGTIPANQDVAAGSYADTVVATINF